MTGESDESTALTSATSGAEPHARVVRRPKARNPTPLALALAFDPETAAAPQAASGDAPAGATVASWSATAFAQLMELRRIFAQRAPHPVSLPIASLRTRLEIADEHIQRCDPRLGTGSTAPGVTAHSILVTTTAPRASRDALNAAALGWLTNEVGRAAQNDEAALASVRRLQQLAQSNAAIETGSRVALPKGWSQFGNHTAKPDTTAGFADLADFVARRLEGQVIFPQLPPLRRIILGDLTTGKAELMTDPIEVSVTNPRTRTSEVARFSLVVHVQVVTYHGRPGPVVICTPTRRIWATSLREYAGVRRLSAYAFPMASPHRALRFTLRRQRVQVESGEAGQPGGTSVTGGATRQPRYAFVPDDDFAPIARAYLENQQITVAEMLDHGLNLPDCRLLIGAKNGVSERTVVKAGVPDRDKADGFDAIASLLAPVGLTPWRGLRPIKTLTRTAKDRNEGWSAEDEQKRAAWRAETQAQIRAVAQDGRHHLVIAAYQGVASMASAQEAQRRLKAALGDAIQITLRPIPPGAHGPRQALPAAEERDPGKRAAVRQRAWDPFIHWGQDHLRQAGQRIDGVLVIAPEWYGAAEGAGRARAHDDAINKRAARTTLIARLGAPAQYLLPHAVADELVARIGADAPPPRSRKLQQADDDFDRRLMNAWLDLAFMTQGLLRLDRLQRIMSAADASNKADKAEDASAPPDGQRRRHAKSAPDRTMPVDEMPDRILALCVARRNSQRWIGNERSVAPVALELDVTTGVCQASFAYEDPATQTLMMTDLHPLPQALAALARLGPMPLSSAPKDRTPRLANYAQKFFAQRLVSLHERSVRPLVLLDADTCRSVWPWLTDSRLDPQNISIAGADHAQVLWPHLRIVRIRADNSPKVLWDQRYTGVGPNGETLIQYRGPIGADADLFQVTDTAGAPTYLSFGSALRHGRKHGTSSYRRLEGLDRGPGSAGDENADHSGPAARYHIATFEPYSEAWTTPNGVEIVVVQTGVNTAPGMEKAAEAAEQVAALVEWLRQCYAHFGEWSAKPAPLHFARLAKEYIADYALDEDDDAEVTGEASADMDGEDADEK